MRTYKVQGLGAGSVSVKAISPEGAIVEATIQCGARLFRTECFSLCNGDVERRSYRAVLWVEEAGE
jgi:hypothetical protein